MPLHKNAEPTLEWLDAQLYLDILRQVTGYFQRKRKLDSDDSGDLYQDLYLAFKEKQMALVVQHYDAQAGSFEDYFRRAAYNKCRELLRSKYTRESRTATGSVDVLLEQRPSHTDPEAEMVIKESLTREYYKLDMFIKLLAKHKERLMLLLKLYSGLTLKKEDLFVYYRNIQKHLIRRVLLLFGVNYSHMEDQAVIEGIFPVISSKEPEVSKASSLRRWLDRQINKITEYLNNLEEFRYNNTSLRSLLLLYFKSKDTA